MGSIQVDEPHDMPSVEHCETVLRPKTNGTAFDPYEVIGLASDESGAATSPTGMREELVLLAWLIVLLRTREDGQATYSWAYSTREKAVEDEPSCMQLSSGDVLPDLQSNIGHVAAAISHHINTVAPRPSAGVEGPASLLLSTGSLSKTPKGANDEVSASAIRFFLKCRAANRTVAACTSAGGAA